MSEKRGRREFLQLAGGTGVAMVLAGCTGDTESSGEQPTRSETSTNEPETPTWTPPPTAEPTETASPTPVTAFDDLVGLTAPTNFNFENQREITREHVAYTEGNRTTTTQSYSSSFYEFYDSQARQYVDNFQYKYGSYVSDRLDKPIIDSIISSFESYGQERGYTERQNIEHMMSFVQNLEYTTDKRGVGFNEYPKYPLETLVEQEGDCEDTAILMANLLRHYGYGTKLIYASGDMTDDGAGGHMAVGIKGNESVKGTYYTDNNGDRYYFIETTSPGTGIGEAPSWMNEAILQPVGVHPVPGAVQARVTEVQGTEITVLGDTVNTGFGSSDGVQVRLTLIDSDRYIIDEAVSDYQSVAGFSGDLNQLGEKHRATTEVTLYADELEDMQLAAESEGVRLVAESLVHGSEVSQTESPLRSL